MATTRIEVGGSVVLSRNAEGGIYAHIKYRGQDHVFKLVHISEDQRQWQPRKGKSIGDIPHYLWSSAWHYLDILEGVE